MNLITKDDINYLAKQSASNLNIILAGMTALMNDIETKVHLMQSQNWFKRMVKTVTGKNKLTLSEIQQNRDKLNAYMAEAIADLYHRNCIDHQIMLGLGTRLNELYVEHLQLKEMLGLFIDKLNEKIDSIDNFHMLTKEIEQGVYSSYSPIVAICMILSQFDKKILEDDRKLDILKRSMIDSNILSDEKIILREYLMSIVDIPMHQVGQIYLELGTIRNNFLAKIILSIIEKYHYLPDMARKIKDKDSIVELVITEERLDATISLSINDIYDDFLNSKIEVQTNVLSTINTITISDTTDDKKIKEAIKLYEEEAYEDAYQIIEQLAMKGNSQAMYYLGEYYYNGYGHIVVDFEEAFKWYMKAAEKGNIDAQYEVADCYYFGLGVEEDDEKAFKWYLKAAVNGDMYAQYEVASCYYNGIGVERNNKEAKKWLIKAAEQGYSFAGEKLIEWFDDNTYSKKIKSETYESIKTACEIFLFFNAKSNYDVTYKLKKHLDILFCDEIYLAHDDTIFKTGKNGFAITNEGIYCRDMFSSTIIHTSFEELAEASEIYRKGSYIYADEKMLAYINTSKSEMGDLVDLFKKIKVLVWGDLFI